MRAAALALAFALASATSAGAAPTPAQRLFTQKLLASSAVAPSVKLTLEEGGFVSSGVLFADLNGDGKEDAVVTVDSGGSAGVIALYVLSARAGKSLRIVYGNERLYRASARINPGPALVYVEPTYRDGDQLCCPSSYLETTLRWSAKGNRFTVAQRRSVTTP